MLHYETYTGVGIGVSLVRRDAITLTDADLFIIKKVYGLT